MSLIFKKLKDKDIDGWLEQKKARNNEFISLKKRYSKLVSESSEDKRKSLAELSEVRRELYTLQSEQANIEKEQQKKRSIVEQSTDQLENLLKSIENRGSDSQLSSTDIKNIRKQVESIRLEFFIWDEEIPF